MRGIFYTYYTDGSRASMTTPAGNYSYMYDSDGRLSSLTNPLTETFSWTYLDNGWLSTQVEKNSSNQVVCNTYYYHNALGELTELANVKADNHNLYSDFYAMSYDAVGNLVSMTANTPATTAYNGMTTYQYDSADQLTQEHSYRNGNNTYNNVYDAAGNPTTYQGTTQSFNGDNQLQGTGYQFDGDGNPTTYKGQSLTFDEEDRLTAYGTLLTCGYTAEGLRAWRQSGSTRTYFLYDGDVPVCELFSSGSVDSFMTWGANGLLSRHWSGTSLFWAFDPQGNPSQKLNSDGSIYQSFMFSAQGVRAGTSGEAYSGFGAQWGGYYDQETGLILFGQRYYDPNTGRFLTRDPIGYDGGIMVSSDKKVIR